MVTNDSGAAQGRSRLGARLERVGRTILLVVVSGCELDAGNEQASVSSSSNANSVASQSPSNANSVAGQEPAQSLSTTTVAPAGSAAAQSASGVVSVATSGLAGPVLSTPAGSDTGSSEMASRDHGASNSAGGASPVASGVAGASESEHIDGGASAAFGGTAGVAGTAGAGGTAGPVGGAGGELGVGGAPVADPGSSGYNPCPSNGEPCRILPFGDSITDGVASSDLGGYRSRLYALIVEANQNVSFTGSQSSGPEQVAGAAFPKNHEGHSGWTIEPGFSNFGSGGISSLVPSPAFDTLPNIVLLMIGTNDVTADSGQGTMPARLESLLDAIVDTAPEALIVLAALTPVSWDPAALTDYNAQIPGMVAARASQGQHIVGVDMSQMPRSGLAADDVHPNDEGYSYMAEVWYDAIGNLLPLQNN